MITEFWPYVSHEKYRLLLQNLWTLFCIESYIRNVFEAAAISETRLPVILAGRVVELRCNGGRVLLLKPHKRRANPSQNVPLKDGKEMRGYYLMAASCRTTHAACRKGMRRPTSGVVRSPREHIKDKIVTLPTISVYNPLGRDKGS